MSEPQQLGTARTHDELVDLLAARKEALGLSNAFIDQYWGYAAGMTDKYLGPTRIKTLGRQSLDDLMMVLGVRLVLEHDPEKIAVMEQQWEQRKPGYAHSPRVSKVSIKKAAPHVLRDRARLGGLVRAHLLTSKQRSRIARHAANTRWRREREKTKKSRVRCASAKPRHRGANGPEISPAV